MRMDILVSIDANYLPPLKVMLTSLFLNNRDREITVYVMHARLAPEQLAELASLADHFGARIVPIQVTDSFFADAPVIGYYPKSMYYRLLAARFLPVDVDRILYLDPDILVLNRLDELYNADIENYLFAACSHTAIQSLSTPINRVRLHNAELEQYYNSGVLLLNLESQRREILPEDIYAYIRERRAALVLPDQDILNGLYGARILPLDDTLYNYDARHSHLYQVLSGGVKDLDWVMANTAVLHFCGKRKPWHKDSGNRFSILWKHYQRQAELASGHAAPTAPSRSSRAGRQASRPRPRRAS